MVSAKEASCVVSGVARNRRRREEKKWKMGEAAVHGGDGEE
jgi:hypothetical protein